jgi:5'-phosphate synthase pdxT subunit
LVKAVTRTIGILALQGAVEPHRQALHALGERAVLCRTATELREVDGLILPGGESTTLLNLIEHYGLREPLREFGALRPMWGVCAGCILMAERVENPEQPSLGLVPIAVRRNAYGRQNESFIAPLRIRLPGQPPREIEAVFIRAPVITSSGKGTQVLAEHGGAPVALQAGFHLITTFHPELSRSGLVHQHFASLCRERAVRRMA